MTADAPAMESVDETGSQGPSPKLPLVRLAAAGLVTVVLLPYAWGFTLITTMMVNFSEIPNLAYLGQLAGGVGAVIALNFHLAKQFSGKATKLTAALLLVFWLIVNGTIVFLSSGPHMAVTTALAGYLPGTLWLLWLSWMFYAKLRWRTRIGVLCLLLVGVASFVGMFRIRDLTGDNRVNFAFVWEKQQAAFEQLPDAAPTEVSADAPAVERGPHDSPQYLGPDRNGVLQGVRLVPDWETQPPRELWRIAVGAGWSSFATIGHLAITQEQRGSLESTVCYDLVDGHIVWAHGEELIFDNTLGGPGPRATPTIDSGQVFSVGATGILNCLDLASGAQVWSVDVLNDNDPGAENLSHGVCASPLVVGDVVVVCPPGGNKVSLAAYDRHSGQRRWQAGEQRASYGSPMLVGFDGSQQILTVTSEGIVGHAADTGAILWDFAWTNGSGVNSSQPIPRCGAPRQVFFSTGYGTGCVLLNLEPSGGKWSPSEVWSARAMKTKFTTPVLLDGHIYGLDDGILQCIDVETGRKKWKRGRYGHGQILLVEDLLIVQTEPGELVLVRPNPEKLVELGTIAALSDKTWNPPVLAGNYLLVRNDREAICFEVALESLQEPQSVALGGESNRDERPIRSK